MKKTIVSLGCGLVLVVSLSFTLLGQAGKPKAGQEKDKGLVLSEGKKDTTEDAQDTDRARDLYYASGADTASKNVGMKVKFFQKTEECDFVQVSARKQFTAGDSLRFSIESNTSGYLYIAQRGTSGKTTLLYPHPEINQGENQIRRGAELMIPGKRWFRFDEKAGTEELIFILSKKKLDIVEYLVPAATSDAHTKAAPSANSAEAEVLSMVSGEKTRDLVYSPETAPAPVVQNNGAVYSAHYAVNSSNKGICVWAVKLQHR
jgi:hypothetical protein